MTTQLTTKQRLFAENKSAGLTNRDAAIAAGYAVAAAGPTAYKLMQHPGVRAAITSVHSPPSKAAPTLPKDQYEDPLSFLLDVMNHTQLPLALRVDAAKHLLPYCHARMGEVGKRDSAKEKARTLSSGHKFSPMRPPQLHVVKD